MGVAVAFLMAYSRVRLRLELLAYLFVMEPKLCVRWTKSPSVISLQCYSALGGRCQRVFRRSSK